MIEINPISPDAWNFKILWPEGLGVRVKLLLTDVDGDTIEKTVEWDAQQNTELAEVLRALAGRIEPLFGWRSSRVGNQLIVRPTNLANTGEVQFILYGG